MSPCAPQVSDKKRRRKVKESETEKNYFQRKKEKKNVRLPPAALTTTCSERTTGAFTKAMKMRKTTGEIYRPLCCGGSGRNSTAGGDSSPGGAWDCQGNAAYSLYVVLSQNHDTPPTATCQFLTNYLLFCVHFMVTAFFLRPKFLTVQWLLIFLRCK